MTSVHIEALLTASAALTLAGYHVGHFLWLRQKPQRTAMGRANETRGLWVAMVMRERRDILAVQTLRNWTMAATFLASTAILVALGILNVALSTEKVSEVAHLLNIFGSREPLLWQLKVLMLSIVFFFAFFNFTLAVRYYNHVGFMINVPVTEDQMSHAATVARILNRGAMHYNLGTRTYYLSIPMALWLLGPAWLLVSAIVMTAALYRLDRPV